MARRRQNTPGGGGASAGRPRNRPQPNTRLPGAGYPGAPAGMSYEQGQAWVWSRAATGASTTPTPPPDATAPPAAPPAPPAAPDTERISASVVLNDFLRRMRIESLAPRIEDWLSSGYKTDAIMVFVRESPEYHQRFPAMRARQEAGHPISEAQYIEFEDTAAELEQYYGLTRGTLDTSTITRLITSDVSARELADRIAINADAARNAPQETRDALQRLYGASVGDLTTYYLDPDRAVDLIRAQYAASKIAGAAAQSQFTLDRATAERLSTLAGEGGAGNRFEEAARQRGLMAGYGPTVTEGELLSGQFGDVAAEQRVKQTGRARTATWQAPGQAGYASSQAGAVGLGSSEA